MSLGVLLGCLAGVLAAAYCIKRILKFLSDKEIVNKIPGPPDHYIIGNAIDYLGDPGRNFVIYSDVNTVQMYSLLMWYKKHNMCPSSMFSIWHYSPNDEWNMLRHYLPTLVRTKYLRTGSMGSKKIEYE